MTDESLPNNDDLLEFQKAIEHLSQAEASLSRLMQGQLDAYIDPASCTPKLLAEAQSELIKGQQRLKQIHDAVACGIIVRDARGTVVHANSQASRMLGIRLSEMIGVRSPGARLPFIREDGSPVPPGQLPSIVALDTGQPVYGSIVGVLNEMDQSFRWLLVTAQPVTDSGGNQRKGVVTTLVDVSQQVQAQREALQNRRRVEALMDLSPVGILVTDTAGRTILANQEMNRLSGMSAHVGRTVDAIFSSVTLKRPNGDPYPLEQCPMKRALRDGERVLSEEIHLELPDGARFPTLFSAVPIQSSEGKVSGAILVMQDISSLEEINKMRVEFLGMVSHELKNPLSNIKGAAYVGLNSREPLTPEDTTELFEMVYEDANRMRDLVEDLLDITQIEAGLISLTLEPDSLEEILAETRMVFSRSRHSHQLAVNIPQDLPLVRVDRRRVIQVLENLLDNAARFSPPSSPISITTSIEADYVTLHVKDEGIGIPKGKQSLLFEKFSRLHTKSGDTKSGIGLGLAICKGIIESHGARIWMESPGEGQGATFSFTLPVSTDRPPWVNDSAEITAADNGHPPKGATVLTVDDEEHATQVLRHLLSQAGYRPVSATDPSQVIPLVESETPDLVILDIRFPSANGFDIFEEIRNHSNAPIIFLTASNKEEDVKRALQLGAVDFITKPYSPERLLACLETALEHQSPRRRH